mmetsp:Transcript_29229/g.74081  ORF Transcript_29229/g.74081 Transcript_29229/m.74081 type:complete len:146 (+) Transcript_29229:675-1112(+)
MTIELPVSTVLSSPASPRDTSPTVELQEYDSKEAAPPDGGEALPRRITGDIVDTFVGFSRGRMLTSLGDGGEEATETVMDVVWVWLSEVLVTVSLKSYVKELPEGRGSSELTSGTVAEDELDDCVIVNDADASEQLWVGPEGRVN